MTRHFALGLSMSGPAIDDAVRGLAELSLLPVPENLEVDFKKQKPTETWFEDAVGVKAKHVLARTDGGHNLVWEPGARLTLTRPGTVIEGAKTLEMLSGLPFDLAAIGQLHDEWYDEDFRTFSFGDGHVPHGWASAFKGEGHDRLVSSRWLDHGPWRLTPIDDATWVEFHDLDADPQTALEQAQPGWERLGISDTGGFIQTGFVYSDDVGGVFDPTEGKLKVLVPRGDVAPRKMLEIAAARRDPRMQDGAIERTAFVFLDEANAHRHLDDLWLYAHEVWAIVKGDEVRLDEDRTCTIESARLLL